MKTTKSIKTVLATLVFGLTLGAASPKGRDEVRINGEALYSFAPDHYLIQTEKYVYKIAKAKLPEVLRAKLETASNGGRSVRLHVPRESIEFLWPARPYRSSEEAAQKFSAAAEQLKSEARQRKGMLVLKGRSALSLSDRFYLVEVNDAIYQLEKKALSTELKNQFNKAGPGGRVEAVVPRTALHAAWSMRPEKGSVERETPGDEITLGEKEVKLTGTVLYSFSDPYVLVQSRDNIFQIRKSSATTGDRQTLDMPGAKIQLSVPIEAIEFMWFGNPEGLNHKRLPASLL